MDRVDEEFVRCAVEEADLNALRLALYHCTKDPVFGQMSLTTVPVRGGATTMVMVEEKRHAELKDRAIQFLLDENNLVSEVTPDDAELRSMMEMLTGESLTDKDFAYRRDVAAFDAVPRAVAWTDGRPVAADGFSVTIIGAGYSGIAVGVQLARLGIDFTIYERRAELGGTWSINQYPDCRVDTTNFVYQYSFEKKYPWTEYFARHDEVRDYLEHVAKKYGVYEHIVFGSDVTSARFDATTKLWEAEVESADGVTTVGANLLVGATGLFAVPRDVNFPGVEDFEGEIVHTARWTPDITYADKNVAVIGNGSTGVQLLSKVSSEAAHVDVYQRTPQWISPRERYGDPISPEMRWLVETMPYYWNWHIYQMIAMGLGTQVMQEPDAAWKARGGLINEANDKFRTSLENYIKTKLGDRVDLVEKVTPDYAPIARRLIVDNNWYASLLRDNVDLVTDKIERLTPEGILTADGVEHPTDLVIAAIGFQVTKYLYPTEFFGRGGVSLEETWSQPGYGGPRAYLSLTVPGFPNFFICYGPNSQPRSGSLISWVEIWAKYIAEAAVTMIENDYVSMEVKQEVFDDFEAKLDKQAESLIWLDDGTGREQNYYVNEAGRVQVGNPWRIEDAFELLADLRPEDYVLS